MSALIRGRVRIGLWDHAKELGFAETVCILARPVPNDSRFRVFRSPIHGYGVIASKEFAPGEVVADVEGILYSEEELNDDRYCLWVEDGFYFDMVDQTRWINHSCDPNVEVQAELDGQGGAWARIVAYRPIAVGEELTYDYAFPAALAEACSCGAPKCSGWIVDTDELPQLVRRLAREKKRKPARAAGVDV